MKCPTCTSESLVMTERSGIEIDYCPACRGVWLDRGELDKLIDRAAQQPAMPATQSYRNEPLPPQQQQQRPAKPDDSHFGYQHGQGQRKKSWFSEIFD